METWLRPLWARSFVPFPFLIMFWIYDNMAMDPLGMFLIHNPFLFPILLFIYGKITKVLWRSYWVEN